ncbi:hypothetical protein OJF2_08930 [Aquisphaera giovannonii]|uniref:Uncharacterized protein n=1 Tax=Aquisphaera giovannonii TaxID=406548 RepID=A0A5B9VVP8_9BACT|nr:hypothetical protein [Aquisphaera giovannonii]QEH32423.1 hypothetical protein OJF2_08930 [Aquisphaera giovannonii]
MGSSYDRAGDSSPDPSAREISTRGFREQSQREFEIDFLTGILERDPYFVEAIRVLANHLAAKGEYARALHLDRRLVRLIPEDGIAWYNLSCSYALLGMLEPAFSSLQKALEQGYRFLDRLRLDPDLKSLRRDPRFIRLLRRFEFFV